MVGQGKTGQGKSKGSNNWGDERQKWMGAKQGANGKICNCAFVSMDFWDISF